MKRENLGPNSEVLPIGEGIKLLEEMINPAWFRASHIMEGDVIYFNPKLNNEIYFHKRFCGSNNGTYSYVRDPHIWVTIQRDGLSIDRLLPIKLLINERRHVVDGKVHYLYNSGVIVGQLCLCKTYADLYDKLLDKKIKITEITKRTVTKYHFENGEFIPYEKEEEFWTLESD